MKATKGKILEERGEEQGLLSSRDRLTDRLGDSATDRFKDVSAGELPATKLACFKARPQSGDKQTGSLTSRSISA